MMKERITEAIGIAEAYRREHNGELPILVVAHTPTETFTVIGKFRKDERGKGEKTLNDQKQFCSVMRIAFALRGVTSYEVICKPEINNTQLQLTQNLLSVFTVNDKGSYGEFFEIEDTGFVPCYSDMEMGSWFSQLLPTAFSVQLDPKTAKKMNKYIDNCLFVPKVIATESKDSFHMLMDEF